MSGTWLRVSSGSVGAVTAMLRAQPAGRSAAVNMTSAMRCRPSVSYTLRTSIRARFCAASAGSTVVGSTTFGSGRACSGIGSVNI